MKPTILGALVCALSISSARAEPAARKGFAEVGLGWGYAMSNGQYLETNNGTQLDPPHASGILLDLGGGYQLAPGIAVIGDFQHARARSIDGVNQDGDHTRSSSSYNSLAAGIRAGVAAGPGELYADFALGLALPFETHRDRTFAGGQTDHTTVGYNAGFGARGEMGYHYAIDDRMYVGVGLRLEAFSTDNAGKTRVRFDRDGQTETTTYTTDPNAQGNTSTAEAFSIQDLRLRIGFGFRF